MLNNAQNEIENMSLPPCPMCGSNNFEWGRLGSQTYYLPGIGLFSRRGANYIRVRRCLQCNNLSMFTHEKLTAQIRLVLGITVAVVLLLVIFAIVLPILITIGTRR